MNIEVIGCVVVSFVIAIPIAWVIIKNKRFQKCKKLFHTGDVTIKRCPKWVNEKGKSVGKNASK